MFIGNVEIKSKAVLAPMAGITDRAFRRICYDFGAGYVVGEMVSSKGIHYSDRKSDQLLTLEEDVRPAGIQLFGSEPDIMAEAAEYSVRRHSPDIIDINMGCPAPKVADNNCGSALMRDPELCYKIVRAVSQAVAVPVTVKIRKGYSRDEVNAVVIAKACEAAGAAAVAVHGRTRDQMYSPPVDWDIIKAVKDAVKIPVIGNGDVDSPQKVAEMYEYTGCDLVMIGRGALGAPWIFSQVAAFLNHSRFLPDPPVSKRMAVLLRQVKLMIDNKGERIALKEARKHTGWYVKGLHGAAAVRDRANKLETYDDLARLCLEIIEIDEKYS